ncbi:MAG: hypothetical protein CMJ20_03470 [Phycisphaeraceae bacterium]|nr:hypothetical protein [Phycisphaeraceae bacterium]
MIEAVPLIVAKSGSNVALVTFGIYMLAVFALAGVSATLLRKKEFLSEYFLGSRSLGMWAFALTFAATSASGGSFMGFPAKIYTHGWIVGFWIAGYIVVPIVVMGFLGKRINQVARKAGAITVPDILHARFSSPLVGALAAVSIAVFMTCFLVAQFKAGAIILQTLLDDVPAYITARNSVGGWLAGHPLAANLQPGYVLCLVAFAGAVILYTCYGGFRAVVWTDVLQGLVMGVGVVVLLGLTLWQVGSLTKATNEIARMTPPLPVTARLELREPATQELVVPFGTWLQRKAMDGEPRRLFRVSSKARVTFLQGQTHAHTLTNQGDEDDRISLLEITTKEQIDRQDVDDLGVELQVHQVKTKDYKFGKGQEGVYVSGPGPSETNEAGFHPLMAAVAFFFFWPMAGAGQPGTVVRQMAFSNTKILQRSIITVAIYYSLIYFPLVIIFCCARILLPGMEIAPDRIMPEMAEYVTAMAGWPWIAGLLLAAPFAAVMSTVDSFLLLISSAVVRDGYQRYVNPQVSEKRIRHLTYAVTFIVGVVALIGAFNPPKFLQFLIIFASGGIAVVLLIPLSLALYWPRFNSHGAVASMIAGVGVYLGGYLLYQDTIKPFLPALAASLIVAYLVTNLTPKPPEHLVKRYFYR